MANTRPTFPPERAGTIATTFTHITATQKHRRRPPEVTSEGLLHVRG
jgi:hypothetical protein